MQTEKLVLNLTPAEADALRWVRAHVPGAAAQLAHEANRAALPVLRAALAREIRAQLAREARGDKIRHKLPANLAQWLHENKS